MNLKFLKTINETADTGMSAEEMNSYLNILYKKCNKTTKVEFNDYLKEQCDVEDADLEKCSNIICDGETGDIVKHLEEISNKLDENSLAMIIGKVGSDEEDA